jgi:hypothetical protein
MTGSRTHSVTLDDEQKAAFYKLRDILSEDLIIIHPNPIKQFFVRPDAGPRAVGGVLTQLNAKKI